MTDDTDGARGFDERGTVSADVLEITGADMAEKFPGSEEVKPRHGGRERLG